MRELESLRQHFSQQPGFPPPANGPIWEIIDLAVVDLLTVRTSFLAYEEHQLRKLEFGSNTSSPMKRMRRIRREMPSLSLLELPSRRLAQGRWADQQDLTEDPTTKRLPKKFLAVQKKFLSHSTLKHTRTFSRAFRVRGWELCHVPHLRAQGRDFDGPRRIPCGELAPARWRPISYGSARPKLLRGTVPTCPSTSLSPIGIP